MTHLIAAACLCLPAFAQTIEKDVLDAKGVRHAHVIPEGTCGTQNFDIELEKTKNSWRMRRVQIHEACNGLSNGLSLAIEGMDIDEVIRRLEKAPPCAHHEAASSCPAQFAAALKKLKAKTPKQR